MSRDELRDKTWDYLVERDYATAEELKLVCYINGYNLESVESVLYARTGYHDLEQLKSEES